MIRYEKGPAPGNLTALSATPGLDWNSLGAADRDPVRSALVRDQGGLCAYCQRRITLESDVKTGRTQMKIEHWQPRSSAGSRPLAWSHLLGVCSGETRDDAPARSSRITQHCDTSRGSDPLFLHPVEGQGPDPLEHLKYTKGGEVQNGTTNPRVDNDIRSLNLNAWRLLRGRKAVFDAAWERLKKVDFARGELHRLEQTLRITRGATAPEHAEFLRYHLRKKLRSLDSRS